MPTTPTVSFPLGVQCVLDLHSFLEPRPLQALMEGEVGAFCVRLSLVRRAVVSLHALRTCSHGDYWDPILPHWGDSPLLGPDGLIYSHQDTGHVAIMLSNLTHEWNDHTRLLYWPDLTITHVACGTWCGLADANILLDAEFEVAKAALTHPGNEPPVFPAHMAGTFFISPFTSQHGRMQAHAQLGALWQAWNRVPNRSLGGIARLPLAPPTAEMIDRAGRRGTTNL